MNGILNINKEKGYTSFDVVAKLRSALRVKKIGHTGTLDPDATGVLPVCLGNATKVCELLTDKDKIYEATMILGIVTDTQDTTGTVLETHACGDITEEEIRRTIQSFVGEIMQVPPMYSAVKVNGVKLVDLARQGIEVERKSRPVQIFSIDIKTVGKNADDRWEICMDVHCSKGTYIRTLCHDIGQALSCGACMSKLRRIKVAMFDIEQAYAIDDVIKIWKSGKIKDILIPVDGLFEQYPTATVSYSEENQKKLDNGNRLSLADFCENNGLQTTDELIRVYDSEKNFVGIYSFMTDTKEYKVKKMFYSK